MGSGSALFGAAGGGCPGVATRSQLGCLTSRPRWVPSKRASWKAEPWPPEPASEQGQSSSEDTPPRTILTATLGPHYTPGAHPSHQTLAVTSSQRSGPGGGRTCKDPAPSRHAGPLCSRHSATAGLWEGAPEGPAQSGGLPAQAQPGLPVPNWAVEDQGANDHQGLARIFPGRVI